MNDWNIMEKLPTMLTGQELKDALKGDIEYSSEGRNAPIGERLIHLNDIYNFYYPNKMGEEIYTKMYISMVRSMQPVIICPTKCITHSFVTIIV